MFMFRKRRGHSGTGSAVGGSLISTRTGEMVCILAIEGGGKSKARLESMGLVPGACVTVLQNHGAGPVLLSLDEARLSLGRNMAEQVLVG